MVNNLYHQNVIVCCACLTVHLSLEPCPDECRKELRDLHESFVSLQAERQLLLEKVIRLESKLTEQQNISEQVFWTVHEKYRMIYDCMKS